MIPGYDILQELGSDEWYLLYRGRWRSRSAPVLLKVPRHDPARAADLDHLARELALLKSLAVDGVVRPHALVRHGAGGALVLDDIGGVPLAALTGVERLPLARCVELALRIAQVLGGLHRCEVVAGGVDPRSVFVEPREGRVQLVDLSRAVRAEAIARAEPPGLQRATLAYLAPERTGRMSLAPDHRADFYSLGVVLYELVTGRRPFDSEDALELIHWQIARRPVPAHEVDDTVPEPLSQVIMKLLEKAPEARYQSAAGLCADLQRCLDELAIGGTIAPFVPGRDDRSERFAIPQRLYGREQEVAQLLESFESVSRGPPALMLVAGYAGIGKTVLIQELRQPIARRHGHFVAGKFDQLARHVPFGALIQAVEALVRELLTEGDAQVAQWRAALLAALGANTGVLTEIVPALAHIIGPQPPPPRLAAAEAQNRFTYVFQNFLATLAGAGHPLAIFLDDLQWADAATLNLLPALMGGTALHGLLLIGAYRDNEVGADHPLLKTVAALEKGGAQVRRIVLQPLRDAELGALVGDTLRATPAAAQPLARLVRAKTDGNPFFVIQFLNTLHQEGMIRHDHAQGCWTFDIDAIARADMTDNVIDLMARRIQRLAADTQRAVTLAACIGNRFDLATLAVVSEQDAATTAAQLAPAVGAGLVLHDDARDADGFRFLHDRVQQAAYAMIPPGHRQGVHLAAGRLLLRRYGRELADARLFDTVNHLNIGAALIADPGERRVLAELNLDAGRRAKSATAYRAALRHFVTGIELLPPAAWDRDYRLSFELHLEAAECEYLCSRFEDAERYFSLLLARAADRFDLARVHVMRIVQFENMSRFAEAVSAGREGLALFGVVLPDTEEGKRAGLMQEMEAIGTLIGARSIAELADLPTLADEDVRTVMRFLTALWAPAYVAGDAPLTSLMSAMIVRLSLEYGNSEESAYGYVTHGITVGTGFGDFERGQAFGCLALAVNARFDDPRLRAKIHHMFSCFVNLWREPLESCLPHAETAYRAALETGDFTYATYAVFHASWYGLLTSRDLKAFEQEYAGNLVFLDRIRNASFADAQRIILNWGLALQGRTAQPTALDGDGFDASAYAHTWRDSPFFLVFLYVTRLQLCYAFEDYTRALQAAAAAHTVIHSLQGTLWPALLDLYHGLTLAALYEEAEAEQRDAWERELQAIIGRAAIRARNCHANFHCGYSLLRAEYARAREEHAAAIDAYEDAIRHARRLGQPQQQGLANELYGQYWHGRGNEQAAALYLQEAYEIYARWGATAKTDDLERRYGVLVGGQAALVAPATPARDQRQSDLGALDVGTVMKAAHAIAAEIVLEDLLRQLIRIAIESAGAQRGLFIENEGGALAVRAQGAVGEQDITVLAAVPVGKVPDLAVAVVNYVQATGEPVIVMDAAQDLRFATDPYVARGAPKSILCMPLMHRGRCGGILYLENNLMAGAFDAARIEVMRILASQAAIALENARLYAAVRQEMRDRERAEHKARKTLQQLAHVSRLASMGEMGSAIAHEINQPLTAIQTYAQAAQRLMAMMSQVPEDVRVALERIAASAALAGDIIRRLRRYVRKEELHRLPVDIDHLIREITQLISLDLRDNDITLILDCAGDLPPVSADPIQIQQVILNLVRNGAEAIQEAACARREVTVRTRRAGERVEVEVLDSGPGVAPSVAGFLFDAFVTTKPDGTGIGLAICRSIVEDHGGLLEVSDLPGGGSVFRFTLPVQA